MVGPPKLDHEAFLTPKLRRCPFDPTTLVWAGRLGGGADGYVWKVKFGDQGPFALKVVCLCLGPLPRFNFTVYLSIVI